MAHSSNSEKALGYGAVRERSGARSCRALYTVTRIVIIVVKVMEKQWEEFNVEREEEDLIIKIVFPKCHSKTDFLVAREKGKTLLFLVCQQHLLSIHCKQWTELGDIEKNKILSLRKLEYL